MFGDLGCPFQIDHSEDRTNDHNMGTTASMNIIWMMHNLSCKTP